MPKIDQKRVLASQQCPFCGADTEHISSAELYGKDYGMMYICRPCDAYVGCHTDGPNKGEAKGFVANKEYRRARQKAHLYFDPLWMRKKRKENLSNRKARIPAYKWLAREMGIPYEQCHISQMDLEQLHRVVEICQPYLTPTKR